MLGYLDEPELTAETLVDGWLHTGDLGFVDASHHLHLVGRRKDVIVTPGGKNVYPEDVEFAFRDVDVEELSVFAANAIWPQRTMVDETLVAVVRPKEGTAPWSALAKANRTLPDFKRLAGWVLWEDDFPRTASMKVKRPLLAEAVRTQRSRDDIRPA